MKDFSKLFEGFFESFNGTVCSKTNTHCFEEKVQT
jgi:hypothetical protein